MALTPDRPRRVLIQPTNGEIRLHPGATTDGSLFSFVWQGIQFRLRRM